jgi:NADPH-dependent glutamate synthase beta subunit-like oxidoreductase
VYDENGQIQIGTLAETLEESGCKFCTACVEVCPTGSLADKSVAAVTRKQDLAPCRAACPAHIDVPGYVRLVAMGKSDEANAVIREKVPFPGVLGRVCIHPCEDACRRGEVNQPVSICALKRYAADYEKGLWRIESRVAADSGKKTAVVGAGPAGLTAAFYLRKKGHGVSLYESDDQAGGMMRYGIPEFRLPRKLLDNEINDIMKLGIDFLPNQCLGRDFSVDGLINDGFDAVFLSMGARLSRRISLPGGCPEDVLWGIDFLRRVAQGEKVRLKKRVIVIGGGNVAVDAARTALRCGAEDVKIACLECIEAMPAAPRHIEDARAEGVQLLFSRGPDKIIHEHGRVVGLDLRECTRILYQQGNFCPRFSDKKDCLPADQIILAVGQTADLSFLEDDCPILTAGGKICVDEDTLETGMKHVYAGGDIAGTPGTVVHAVAAGRRAAAAIDRSLGGNGNIDEVLFARSDPDPRVGREEGFAFQARVEMPELDTAARIQGFEPVALGFNPDQAAREARRCLQCDLRLQIRSNPAPPKAWLRFDNSHVQEVPETEGVFQLLDVDCNVMTIKGTANLRQGLKRALEENAAIVWFDFEEVKMYSMRESEMIQNYFQAHGRMPGGSADDLDDLY